MDIAVGLVEDHSEFRHSLEYLLDATEGMQVTWSYPSAEDALKNYVGVDVILLDINLPGISGVESVKAFKQKNPAPKIIMLTILEDETNIRGAIMNGADGYILKKTSPENITDAILQVHSGAAALTPMIAKNIMDFLGTSCKY